MLAIIPFFLSFQMLIELSKVIAATRKKLDPKFPQERWEFANRGKPIYGDRIEGLKLKAEAEAKSNLPSLLLGFQEKRERASRGF